MDRLDATAVNSLRTHLDPYLDSGVVHRVKLWTVRSGTAEIVYSDEARVIGAQEPYRTELARQLSGGHAVAMPVPDDREHQFESADADRLLEVFIAFPDAAGNSSLLEFYVPVEAAESGRASMAVVVPVTLAGILLLALALIPIGVAQAREVDRGRRERREALRYGLAAAELTRREMAQDLHDEVLPRLASARLLLDAADRDRARTRELVAEARQLIAHDVDRIRGLLVGLAPSQLRTDDPEGLFTDLGEGFRGRHDLTVTIAPGVAAGPDAFELLHRVATELLRNATRHSQGQRIDVQLASVGHDRISLRVTDDGLGFDVRQRPDPEHLGLLLVRRTVEDVGGELTVTSTVGVGTTVTAVVPAGLVLPRSVSREH
ncbi:sensor histidine kinase [Cryptosporangium phraense]|uniref:Oxygen sensor histidine kinase NreB n=1 Tax=Cryptosporangium phraense TaxID=2593070 RepID=A0A545AVH3_9ACTN|nr:ATP-binding protein [Cryptosporangium phraense]TQS45326.1 hypothetical protein FL583_09535 [Cryptosporangium phraense]